MKFPSLYTDLHLKHIFRYATFRCSEPRHLVASSTCCTLQIPQIVPVCGLLHPEFDRSMDNLQFCYKPFFSSIPIQNTPMSLSLDTWPISCWDHQICLFKGTCWKSYGNSSHRCCRYTSPLRPASLKRWKLPCILIEAVDGGCHNTSIPWSFITTCGRV
jgi:hypothetical protein